jgi:hypothetical protein
MYARTCETLADFSRGCAGERVGYVLFVTDPTPRFATRVRFLVTATNSWMRKYPLCTERTLLVCVFPHRQLHFKGLCAHGTERCYE